ncbi:Rieske 2Fe-2S domain-containing protein [Sphingosinicella humi]|uniref:(2Fe-2S)-binding protein n=1 Tax=Allosphingosinicella humi TaxID=2068657 RepID=A0A2U2J580_9SPHN|nr:Rieske 2Fe-2S domain-containing protein [Sphingosinicella humi]PWG03499.1 (2Fe-2S)-binding protein [Sphingosinicella humi]
MASAAQSVPHSNPVRRAAGPPVKAEGEDGLFTQSWFPICLSSDVGPEEVKGFDFLDGRIVVYRGASGQATVASAYCPHMGADLAVGRVIGDRIRCAFHHWDYDLTGKCVATMVGDPPPPTACLYVFPSQERYGLIWAFNGEEPLFELPDFPFPEKELAFKTIELPGLSPVDPWVQCCNTPDMQHIKALHGVSFNQEDPHEAVRWTDFSCAYDFDGTHVNGEHVENSIAVYGTSLYYQSTFIDGKWFGFLVPMGLPKPGHSKNFMVAAGKRADGTPREVEEWLDFVIEFEKRVVGEDLPIMNTIRFRPGTLTKSDKTFARYLKLLRAYPRAHPSAEFIK